MILSDRQAHTLFQTVIDTLKLTDGDNGSIFAYSHEQRLNTINEIMRQQNNKLRDLTKPMPENIRDFSFVKCCRHNIRYPAGSECPACVEEEKENRRNG